MNHKEFAQKHNLTLHAERVVHNPHLPDFEGDHWQCLIQGPTGHMSLYFSRGYGHNGRLPQIDEILECLASDALSVTNAGYFQDWAQDMGFDPDSRSAERTYKLIVRQSDQLQELLGEEAYEELLFETEEE